MASLFVMPHTVLQLRTSDLDWREVDGEVVVLDRRQSRYFAINETGRVLWTSLREGATRSELVDRLAEAFEIDRARAAADVDAFTAELEGRGMLVRSPSAA